MVSKRKVCHIVSWYPNKWNEKEALWVKRHIKSLEPYVENEVYHIQVREGKFGIHSYKISDHEQALIVTTKLKIWFIKELLTTFLLFYTLLFKISKSKVDIYNFHIAYPMLTYSRVIVKFIRKQIYVTEHWSAYHFNFGVTKDLKRIKRIFSNDKLRFICVSSALKQDIEQFSGQHITSKIIPNAIDESIFKWSQQVRRNRTLFILSYWKEPKNPFPIMEAVKELQLKYPDIYLEIGGFGPLMENMSQWIIENSLTDKIVLLGQLNSDEISKILQRSTVFLHSSDYEVASVVCMEALCCGCPVIASNVGGIKEYINPNNGILVDNNNVESWVNSIERSFKEEYNYSLISSEALNQFSIKCVGEKYYQYLMSSYL
ncbi:MAG: glycosyltransferase family 4 protein [Flavobacteriales bacterium]|nr:glycosyltransferase family 4 protein [Flavobacteriales bacterium]